MNVILQNSIEQGTAHRKSRDENTAFVLNNPELLPDLAAIACNTKDKNHYKALWVMELISIQKPEVLMPYLDVFCASLPHYKIEKAIRPGAKICFQLVKSKNVTLTQQQEEQIIETCLDWLITNVKIAPAAFAMRALYLLGKKYNWVNDELKLLLSRDIDHPSPGYVVVVKELLKRLK